MSYLDERRNLKLFGKSQPDKKLYSIPKQSEKKKLQLEENKKSGTDEAMDKFYEEARKEMTGHCLFCGDATEKDNDETYRRSIAHLFAKRPKQFPSIKLHPANRIELCFWKNSCHTNFDTTMITLEDIKYQKPEAWRIIVEKAKILYHCMTKEEKNRVPEILLKEILYPF